MAKGIIVRIDWNDNKWEKPSNNLDNANNFGFVRDNNISHTSFNFAHEIYSPEPNGLWYGLIPAFGSKTPDPIKIRDLKVVFIISNYEHKDLIVGLYSFPIIGNSKRTIKVPDYIEYDWINIGSNPKNILRLENYVEINSLNLKKALGNQKISLRGWNYIEDENVGYIFDSIQKANPENEKLKQIKLRCLR